MTAGPDDLAAHQAAEAVIDARPQQPAEIELPTIGGGIFVREGVSVELAVRAIKLGLDSHARWFAIDQIQSVYAQQSTWRSKEEAALPIEDQPGCVYVGVAGITYGVIVGCKATMREAQAVADHYAEIIWGSQP